VDPHLSLLGSTVAMPEFIENVTEDHVRTSMIESRKAGGPNPAHEGTESQDAEPGPRTRLYPYIAFRECLFAESYQSILPEATRD